MNYRHLYHAGNFADVLKHAVLALVLAHLRVKDSPFFALDTHAGAGLYDLRAPEAQKTAEAAGGIGALAAREGELPQTLTPYMDIVHRFNTDNKTVAVYPGSPLLIQDRLRDDDRMVACELHPEQAAMLGRSLGRDRRVRVETRDGYAALRALLPPPQRRGLVLIDPPFEKPDEFSQMIRSLKEGYKRFSNGIFLLWHPIKSLAPVQDFHAQIRACGIADVMAASLFLRPPEDPALLNGSGLVIVNPPWTLEAALEKLLPDLARFLTMDRGFAQLERLAEE